MIQLNSMKRLNLFIKSNLLIFSILFFYISFLISQKIEKPFIRISKQDESWKLNGEKLSQFHLGFKRLESSLLWISTILEGDVDHYKKKDLNSWMFLRFKTIADLEPKFYENYTFGGQYLSIVKDDLAGATYLYNKGLTQYPNDFDLLKNAAFHFHFEEGDTIKSFKLYSKLRAHPRASGIMISTLARLESANGNLEVAFELLKSQYEKLKDKNSFIANKIFEHMYAIKAEIDLNCLNLKKLNCAKFDLDGTRYISNRDSYYAKKNWTPFRPKGKNGVQF